jgi:hypothetical protein
MAPRYLQIRNAAFYLMLAAFASLFAMLGSFFDIPCNIVGVLGLLVVLLTIRLGENRMQKLFFILAGGAGAGYLITMTVFRVMGMLGHKPGGDGGGITVAMFFVVLPPLFIIGAVGSIVLLIKGRVRKNRNMP